MVRGSPPPHACPMTSTPPSTHSPARRFLRSREDKKLAGVCGGLAKYFNIDPVLVRIATVVLATMGGAGIVAYVAAWIFVPYEEQEPAQSAPPVAVAA